MTINWGILSGARDPGAAFQDAFAAGQKQAAGRAAQDALRQYGANPSAGIPSALWAADARNAAILAQNDRQRVVAERQTLDALRQTQARSMVPDVLEGLGLGGAGRVRMGAAATAPGGEVTVTAPVEHETIADVYALDAELAGHLVTQVGAMQEQQRKQVAAEADALAAAAFAARQAPYAKRRDVIDSYRQQLVRAGFSQGEIDDFDPTDEALGAAITHSLGIKGALSQQMEERKFDWQRQDDRIDNARDDRRVGIQAQAARDANARGWSADRRAERRFVRGDGASADDLPSDDLLRILRSN